MCAVYGLHDRLARHHGRVALPGGAVADPGVLVVGGRQGPVASVAAGHARAPGALADVLRLLHGPSLSDPTAISQHYATHLALLAKERGFDGWLLNFEVPMFYPDPDHKGRDTEDVGLDRAKLLMIWIELLRKEVEREVVGGEVVWCVLPSIALVLHGEAYVVYAV